MLAFDRSLRHFDADGHLRVESCNLSKATVNPYFGREIPDWETLGLDPDRIYNLYRDPAELAAAASTMDGKPLLLHHTPVTADEPATDLVVGAIGAATFAHPYLKGPISVWRRDAIDVIESEEQRELSPGYRYRPDMTPGVSPEGLTYDGVMRDISFNHVALVREGRTGPDVVVADRVPKNMRFSKFLSALTAAFGVVAKPEQLVALDAALDAELKESAKSCVEDEFPDLSEDERSAAIVATGKAMDALTDEEKRNAYKAAKDAKAKPAMDAAIAAAVAEAVKDKVTKSEADTFALDAARAARAEVHALYTARAAVEPTAGVVALDSAEAVYRFALDALKVEHKEIPATALPALYEQAAKVPALIAQDAAPLPSLTDLFPGLTHIRRG